jgi:hypothetical protein
MLWVCAGLFIVGSSMLLTLGKYPHFDRVAAPPSVELARGA